jgi:hypothetical protein
VAVEILTAEQTLQITGVQEVNQITIPVVDMKIIILVVAEKRKTARALLIPGARESEKMSLILSRIFQLEKILQRSILTK